MSTITRFEDLKCWKESRILTREIYKMSSKGILTTEFDTRNQLRRSALSSMNNIAEGFARFHRKDFKRFLDISQSSTAEVKSMLYVLEDLNYYDKGILNDMHEQVDKTRSLTLGMIRYLDKNPK